MDLKKILKPGFLTTEAGAAYAFVAIAGGLFTGQIPWNPEFGPIVIMWLGWLALAVILSRTLLKAFALLNGKDLPATPPVEPEQEAAIQRAADLILAAIAAAPAKQRDAP